MKVLHRYSGKVLWEDEETTIKETVVAATTARANLRGANLQDANLRGADVSNIHWPSPSMVMLASWGELSDELTTEMMRYDAANHPEPARFQEWAYGRGGCPYDNTHVQRSANFAEKRELYTPGPSLSVYELMVRVLKEKCKEE